MQRRTVLGVGLLGISSIAGCGEFVPVGADSPELPDIPTVEDPPDAVYVPTHREAMRQLSTVKSGDFAVTPMVTYPHPFWIVTGQQTEPVIPEDGRGVHLMATIWDPKTDHVLPVDSGAEMRIFLDNELVDQRAPWPMISQTMGFHIGDNIPLPDDGTYHVELTVNPITSRKTGEFVGRFTEATTLNFEFAFDEAFREEVIQGVKYVDEELWGERGALDPMDHHHVQAGTNDAAQDSQHVHDSGDHMPFSALAPGDDYPGGSLGEPTSGDATIVVRYLENSAPTEASGYLFISPRTPYNRVPLADMALSVEGAIDGELTQTFDDTLGLHYGISGSLEEGDELTIQFESPPQVARHQGYETAFLEMNPVSIRYQS